jgi:hypothetical protein
MPLQTGQMLNNRYRIVKLLGQGGFGAVYRAWDTNLSRPCAVKENLDTSPEAHRQFSREATVLANLSHPNMPRVTDHFSLAGQGQYLVMDFVDGEDLASKLEKSGPLPLENALHWIVQVADALSYLHSRQPPVLHRDIKPANIRITPAGAQDSLGKAMLVDFGLVKVSAPHMKTTVGARAVTPGYAPPEQYGQGTTDTRTDLYALGATLYSLLTNQKPLDSLQRMMGKPLLPISQFNPQIPAQLSKVIERAMSLDSKQRYQSAEDFKAALSVSIPTLPGSAAMLIGSEATIIHSPSQDDQVYGAAAADSVGRFSAPEPTKIAPVPGGPQPYRAAPVRPRPAQAYPAAGQAYRQRRPLPAKPVAGKRAKRGVVFWGGILALVVLCLGSVIGVVYYLQAMSGLSDADYQATVERRVKLTSTAQAEFTETASVETGAITPTAVGAESSEDARNRLIDAAMASRTLVLGPKQGSLAHDPGTQMISGQMLGVDIQYFILEVRFYNPYAASQAGWDYGVLFRHQGPNEHFRLILRSDKVLVLMNNTGQLDGEILFEGNLPDLNVDEGGWNLITLYCLRTEAGQDRGYVFINKTFVAELDLSGRSSSGDIAVVTGTYSGDQVQGETTEFQDLSLWSVP